jgi:hypothetical protein
MDTAIDNGLNTNTELMVFSIISINSGAPNKRFYLGYFVFLLKSVVLRVTMA